MSAAPRIRQISLIAMKAARQMPSLVIVIFQTETSTSPSVRNRLNTTEKIRITSTGLRPLSMNPSGMREQIIIAAEKENGQ